MLTALHLKFEKPSRSVWLARTDLVALIAATVSKRLRQLSQFVQIAVEKSPAWRGVKSIN